MAAVPVAPTLVLAWPKRPFVLDLAAQASQWFIAFGLLLTVILLATRHWRQAAAGGALTLLSLCVYSAVVKPTRLPEPLPSPGSYRLRIASFNAYVPFVQDHTAFLQWALERNPDLIAIVEGPLTPESCNDVLRDRGYTAVAHHMREYAPLWSRHPVRIFREYWSGAAMTPGGVNPFLIEMPDGQAVAICSMHLSSPRRASSWKWDLDMAEFSWPLLRRLHGHAGLPLVLIGDFNTTRAGRLYRELYATTGLTDAEASFYPGSTWPAYMPGVLGFGIDHCWVSPGVAVTQYEVGPALKSDHRPLFVELAIPPKQDGDYGPTRYTVTTQPTSRLTTQPDRGR